MGSPLIRTALSFLFPGGVLFTLALLIAGQPRLVALITPLAHIYAAAILLSALLLGWRFDRSRLVFSALVIGLALWLLGHLKQQPPADAHLLYGALALLLPLNMALLAGLKERGIFTWHGLLRWGLILAQPLLLWSLFRLHLQHWLAVLDTTLFPLPSWMGLEPLPQPALLAFALALFATSFQGLSRHNQVENGMFWAVLLLFYTLLGHLPYPVVQLLLGSAVLIVTVAVIEASYSMAYRDELTGLPARRALNHDLLKLGNRYTVAMLDVDHFKKFNDRYGHDVGDEVLKMVAARLAGVSGGGKAYRYGGEEFTVLFGGKELEACLPHLERVREAIAGAPFTVRGGKNDTGNRRVTITISIGAAQREGEIRKPQDAIKAADKALYRAKKAGRNCVAT